MNSDPSSNQERLDASTSESDSDQQLAEVAASELADLALDPEVETSPPEVKAPSESDYTDIWFDDEEEIEPDRGEEPLESTGDRPKLDLDSADSAVPVNESQTTESEASIESAAETESPVVNTENQNLAASQASESDLEPASDIDEIAETYTGATPESEDTALVDQLSPESSEPDQLNLSQVELQTTVDRLEQQKQTLETEIRTLQATKNQLLSEQLSQIQETIAQLIQENTQALQQEKQALQSEIEQLQRRRDRIAAEMRTNFAGVSQDLAVRVQGFKQYLVGSLQDLAAAAEQLDLPKYQNPQPTTLRQPPSTQERSTSSSSKGSFSGQSKRIRQLLEQYRSRPDYYGPPWQLRRTFEPIHAERVQDWFINQGGKGAIRSMGSRLQNILIASAVISIMHALHGNRCHTLILSETPERLGEWRRGLQDCLGISRSDFSPNRGVVLFETPEALVQKAERLVESRALPLIIIDETEEKVNLSLLQFPLWLAFAPNPQQMNNYTF